MPRNLVLCFDGTNNEFGPENTNVVRLAQVLGRSPDTQRMYYDPGVGTLPEPSAFTKVAKKTSEIFGLAFGAGLPAKVELAYSYLMDFWEPGDQVFLFGFSRGAYTARVLAGMLHTLGLLARGNHNLVPYAMRIFRSIRGSKGKETDKEAQANAQRYWDLCDDFRWTFARPIPGAEDDRRFPVHFMGLWDTVSSVGWVYDPATFPFTRSNKSVSIIRHAVSIDERRAFFRQNLMTKAKPEQDFSERWFAGVHSDVGGGYRKADGELWRPSFQWILDAARNHGLRIDPDREPRVLPPLAPAATPWNDMQHESLTPAWKIAEYFPKQVWSSTDQRVHLHRNKGRRRSIKKGSLIDSHVLRRIRETNYRPPNLSTNFINQVLALPAVPDELEYFE